MATDPSPRGRASKARAHGSPGEDRLTIGLFFALLWLPLLVGLLQSPQTISPTENRYLASRPAAPQSRAQWGELPAALARYFSDHLGLRDWMITTHARIKVGGFAISPSEKLIVGEQGWFYLNDPTSIAQYRGLARFDADELARWKDVLVERRDWLAARGIAYVVVLAPNKPAVYPEFMPEHLTRIGELEQHRQLARHLAEQTDLTVVDLLLPLLRAKQQQRVYHKTDTHWNDVGAYLAYREVLAAVREVLPRHAEALHPVEVKLRRYEDRGIGLTSMVGLRDHYREEILELRKIEPQAHIKPEHREKYAMREHKQLPLAHGTDDANLPRAVMFRDSFANALIPYLSENFTRILYVWTRDLVPAIVEREKPDVVIQEIAGRLLDRAPTPIRAEAPP